MVRLIWFGLDGILIFHGMYIWQGAKERERDNLPSGVYRINMKKVHIPTHIPSKERQSINLINSSHYTYTLAVPQLLYILPTEDI